jgi:hypothetical protein
VVGAACVAGAAIAAVAYANLRHDDAFITFRYARNIATGQGYVFNPGERVLGATSPLHAVVLAGVYAALGDVLPSAAVAIGATAVGAQAWCLFHLLRGLSGPSAVAVALLCLTGQMGSFPYLALETNTFAALLLGALWAAAQRRASLAGVLAGVATLCRYEGVLLAGLLAVRLWWRGERGAGRLLGMAALVSAPWLVFATVYFGSALPNTLHAKTGITPPLAYLFYQLERFLHLPLFAPGHPYLDRALSGCAIAVGAWRLRASGCVVVALLPLALAQVGGYALIGPHRAQHWHMYVPLLAARMTMVVGLLWVLERAVARFQLDRRLVTLFAVGYALTAVVAYPHMRRDIVEGYWFLTRHRRYEAVADWVNAHVRPQQRFLVTEIGTLGYHTPHRLIDAHGLINWTNDWPRSYGAEAYLALVRRFEPDLLLADAPQLGAYLERESPYRTVKLFEWGRPASTVMVRRASVLKDPEEFPRLRAALGAPP